MSVKSTDLLKIKTTILTTNKSSTAAGTLFSATATMSSSSSSPPLLSMAPSPSAPEASSQVSGAQLTEQMLRRRLRALGHFDADGVNANGE